MQVMFGYSLYLLPAGAPSIKLQKSLVGPTVRVAAIPEADSGPSHTSTQLWFPSFSTPCHAGVPTSLAGTPTVRSASMRSSEMPVHEAYPSVMKIYNSEQR